MAPRHLVVAIVGGGPGGLATAIALQSLLNVSVTIYEKATVLREVGAGISIGQNSWNVLNLLGVATSLTSGYPTTTVLNLNGLTGEELDRNEKKIAIGDSIPIRTQRTKLQAALLSHVDRDVIRLSHQVVALEDLGVRGVELKFADGTSTVADLVVGADGIRSVVRDAAWLDFQLHFTGTTIWRTLIPWDEVKDLDPRFTHTAWWHDAATHVYLSPVGEGLFEISCRAYQDPETHRASKVSWGVPVTNERVLSHFTQYLPQIKQVLETAPEGSWREFAAFAGPELPKLTNWHNKIVLVGDASHALSGAFGSGAGFAMEDGFVLAEALRKYDLDVHKALRIFDKIRVPYYSRLYAHLATQASRKAEILASIPHPSQEDRVRVKIIREGDDMRWVYHNHIGQVFEAASVEEDAAAAAAAAAAKDKANIFTVEVERIIEMTV